MAEIYQVIAIVSLVSSFNMDTNKNVGMNNDHIVLCVYCVKAHLQ